MSSTWLGSVRSVPAFALLTAVVAGGCGSGHEIAAGPVPWVNRPLPRYEMPAPKVIPYPVSAPRCHAGEVRISQGRGGAAAGTFYQRLVFTNVGRRSCLLRGYPTINARAASGSRSTLHPGHEGFTFFYLVAANLAPGGHSFIGLATSVGCDNGTRKATIYRQLHVTIAGDEIVDAPAGVAISEVCGLYISSFGRPARYTPLAPRPGTPATAAVGVHMPARVRAGSVLRYRVTLSNPTMTTITLKPCPGYSEGIYASGLIVRRSLALNCDRVRAIGARDHVAYEMELAVPRDAPPGISKFSWSLNEPNGPSAGGVITITSPRIR